MLKINLNKFSYLNDTILENIDFKIEKGTQLSLIGESGCGKSSLLKIIYGLLDCDNGTFFWSDVQILGPKFHLVPGMPFMKYLAQDFDLMPFITVAENVGKYLSNFYPEKKKARIAELLEIVEMTEYANVKAKFLSGGQMQRVAIARVLALEPEVLLLDEPFSHIDNFRKNSLRRKLFGYLKEQQITCIVATHDSTDVLAFADEVAIIKDGEIIESGIPKFIYENPKNRYVASLFGDVNEIEVNGEIKFVYPHQLKLTLYSDLKVEIVNSYFRGSHYLMEAKYGNRILFFENDAILENEEVVCLKKV